MLVFIFSFKTLVCNQKAALFFLFSCVSMVI